MSHWILSTLSYQPLKDDSPMHGKENTDVSLRKYENRTQKENKLELDKEKLLHGNQHT